MRSGRCERCGRRWHRWWRRRPIEHVTQYTMSTGVFALCERCWSRLSIEDRIPFYRALWSTWFRYDGGARSAELYETWTLIEAAVRRGA